MSAPETLAVVGGTGPLLWFQSVLRDLVGAAQQGPTQLLSQLSCRHPMPTTNRFLLRLQLLIQYWTDTQYGHLQPAGKFIPLVP